MKYLKIEMAKMTCQTSNKCQASNPISKIELPFPPIIRASDIVNRRKPSRVKSKSPNAFLIYRKAFLNELSHLKHNLRMTDVSKLVSKYWGNETEDVKDEYRKIAQQVEVELNEKRKKTVSYRVVWKNSKYSARKRNQIGKVSRNNEVNTATFKAAIPPNRDNVFYQFVPAFPDAEFTSKSSKKREKEVALTSEPKPKNSCSSPTNSQISSSSSSSSSSDCLEPHDNLNFDPNLQPYQSYQPCNLQPEENLITGHLLFDENVDWYIKEIYNM